MDTGSREENASNKNLKPGSASIRTEKVCRFAKPSRHMNDGRPGDNRIAEWVI
jgi:hypothetical protein